MKNNNYYKYNCTQTEQYKSTVTLGYDILVLLTNNMYIY